MSDRYPGGLIRKTPPTITPPVDGEGGSASGIWTMDQVAYYIKEGTWPLPILPRYLYSWGDNTSGMLGLNLSLATDDRSSPVQVGSLGDWAQTACTLVSVLAVKTDGTLWSWGSNNDGQLGQGDRITRSSPVQVGALTNWAQVSVADDSSLAVKTNGTLWSWGKNDFGQLGVNNLIARSSPVQIGSNTDWASCECASNSGFAVTTDGKAYSWGNNAHGELMTNEVITTRRSSPVQIGALTNWYLIKANTITNASVWAVKTDGTFWSCGYASAGALGTNNTVNRSSPVQVGALTTWSKPAGGYSDYSGALRTDGTAWVWGNNSFGNLGLNRSGAPYPSSPVQLGAETNWTDLIFRQYGASGIESGKLYGWGRNIAGVAGLDDTIARSSPVQVGADTDWARVFSNGGAQFATKKS